MIPLRHRWLGLGIGLLVFVVFLEISVPPVWAREQALRALLPAWEPVRESLIPPSCADSPQRFPQAIFFQEAIASSRPDAQWMTHTGRALWLNGECEAAQHLWLQAAEAGYKEAWFELLTVGANVAWPKDVAPALETYAAWKGDAAKKAGLTEAALVWYRRAFDILPTRTSAQRVVGLSSNDPAAQAEVWVALVQRTAENDPSHWWGIAKSAELNKAWGVAAAAYEEGARLSDKPYDFWMGAAAAWVNLKAWPQAEAATRAAITARPDLTSPWLYLGHIFRWQKRWDEARAAYLEVQRIKPQEAYVPLYLGVLGYEMGDDLTARRYLLQALELKPQDPGAAYYLAQVSSREGKPDEAEQWMTQAVTWNAERKPYGWALQLGDWRLALGRCTLAREAYDLAREWGLKQETYDARLKTWAEQCAP